MGQGTQDLGFRSDLDVLFTSEPAVAVTLDVRDVDGRPTTASFLFRDALGGSTRRRAAGWPPISGSTRRSTATRARRSTWRRDGTRSRSRRGPEYEVEKRTIEVPRAATHRESFALKRWIHPAKLGWFSGDHHIHAAGCGHYERPTEGVRPEDMMRHILGEDLDVGCVLSWGPCWYAQKAFFEGKDHPLSTPEHLMRYDVEVSGFPSSHCGPPLPAPAQGGRLSRAPRRSRNGRAGTCPVLKWAKGQGAVVGFSHSGWGLKTADNALPSLEVPPFDGIGAMEYIVDVAHDAVDFISAVDTPAPWELTIWYHTLNCGYRTRISGETDFPCIYGERVGAGSVLRPAGRRRARTSTAGSTASGTAGRMSPTARATWSTSGSTTSGSARRGSERKLDAPGLVTISAKVAALLDPEPPPRPARSEPGRSAEKPYWDLERARIEETRTVPVEVVVNGKAVARMPVEADGTLHDVRFRVEIERSSWVALRIYPSSHTNPIFVTVADRPIRASKASAEWCLKAVDRCWSQKSPGIRPTETSRRPARPTTSPGRPIGRSWRSRPKIDRSAIEFARTFRGRA